MKTLRVRAAAEPIPVPPSKPLRAQAGALLTSAVGILERRLWLVPLILALVYMPGITFLSQHKALWHDELFTYYIAKAPSLSAMWHQFNSMDLNPPMIYLLTRGSFRLFGAGTQAARLPELLFFLLAILAIYYFVARRMGRVYGGFAAALLMMSKTGDLALEARPYTLLIGFFALALVSWQHATEGSRRGRQLAIALLGAAIAGMLLSHIFALLTLAALAAGEAWRAWRRRRLDLPVTAALILPCCVTLCYIPMLHNHDQAIFPASFQPTGETVFDFYIGSIEREVIALVLTALAVLIILGPTHLRAGVPREQPRWSFQEHEWVTTIALLASPLLLIAFLMVTHAAFFPRYGASAGFGVALLTTALLGRWTGWRGALDPRAALMGMAIALLISGLPFRAVGEVLSGEALHPFRDGDPQLAPCQACGRTSSIAADGRALPLVDASGLTFLEMNHHEAPEVVDRLYYLTDPAASKQFAHANIFERMAEVTAAFHLRGHVMRYGKFVSAHPHFYVLGRYDYPEDWLLRKLNADGAAIRVLERTSDNYRDTELYEVHVGAGVSK